MLELDDFAWRFLLALRPIVAGFKGAVLCASELFFEADEFDRRLRSSTIDAYPPASQHGIGCDEFLMRVKCRDARRP
ncbi:MAG TPA: hypothetical protein VGC55_00855 [Dokdonella sp.]